MKKIIVSLGLGVIFSVSGCMFGMDAEDRETRVLSAADKIEKEFELIQEAFPREKHFFKLRTAYDRMQSNELEAKQKINQYMQEKMEQKDSLPLENLVILENEIERLSKKHLEYKIDILCADDAIQKKLQCNRNLKCYNHILDKPLKPNSNRNQELLEQTQRDKRRRKMLEAKKQKQEKEKAKKALAIRNFFGCLGITVGLTAITMSTLFYLYPDHFPHRALTQTPL